VYRIHRSHYRRNFCVLSTLVSENEMFLPSVQTEAVPTVHELPGIFNIRLSAKLTFRVSAVVTRGSKCVGMVLN